MGKKDIVRGEYSVKIINLHLTKEYMYYEWWLKLGERKKKSQYGVTDPTSVHTRTGSLCHPPLSTFSEHFRERHTCSLMLAPDDLTTFNTCSGTWTERRRTQGGNRVSKCTHAIGRLFFLLRIPPSSMFRPRDLGWSNFLFVTHQLTHSCVHSKINISTTGFSSFVLCSIIATNASGWLTARYQFTQNGMVKIKTHDNLLLLLLHCCWRCNPRNVGLLLLQHLICKHCEHTVAELQQKKE